MTCAVVVGQSHTVCIAQAALANPALANDISIYRFSGKSVEPGSLSLQEAVGLIKEFNGQVPVFLSIVGGIHNVVGLVRQDRDFDFFLHTNESLADLDVPDIVPHKAIVDMFDFHLNQASKYLAIKDAARGHVYLVASPPPKQSNDFMMDRFANSKKQVYRGQNVAKIGLNTPRLRRKFWILETERSRMWAERHGMRYLAAPLEACDDHGFLKECYYEDATHANADYGVLVLYQMKTILKVGAETERHG